MSKMNSGQFVADGNAVNVDVGFVPDFVIAFEGLEETSPNPHFWFRSAIDALNSDGEFGLLVTGTDGIVTKHAAAANGFAPLDTVALRLLMPNPAGGDDLAVALPDPYTVARSTAATARTATALGTVIKPSVGNETGLVYECITAGTGSAEPTSWPTVAGDRVLDNDVEYIAREENLENRGIKGFTLGADGQTDTDGWKWVAFSSDKESADRDMVNSDNA